MIKILVRTINEKVDDPFEAEEFWINSTERALNAEFIQADKIKHDWKEVVYKYYFRIKE